MCSTCGCEEALLDSRSPAGGEMAARGTRVIDVSERLLADNERLAAHNRKHFDDHDVWAVNVMGAPGAGKTALLTATIAAANGQWRVAVIEGDQATRRDADRIAAAGAPVVQVETGLGCHLDAQQVHRALDELVLAGVDVVFIENIGNLVCPALFDVGAHVQVVVTSPTEGADKPLKYPPMFRAADLIVLNKIDLLPYVPFDLDEWHEFVARINSRAPRVLTSALEPSGVADWWAVLAHRSASRRAAVRP